MKNSILFLTGLLAFFTSIAQPAKWHAFEGYFRATWNEDLVWQFIAQDSVILAKPLWADREFHLLPDTGLAFVSRENVERGQHVHFVFQRDASGVVNQT